MDIREVQLGTIRSYSGLRLLRHNQARLWKGHSGSLKTATFINRFRWGIFPRSYYDDTQISFNSAGAGLQSVCGSFLKKIMSGIAAMNKTAIVFKPRMVKNLSQTEAVERWQGSTEMAQFPWVFAYNHTTTGKPTISQFERIGVPQVLRLSHLIE